MPSTQFLTVPGAFHAAADTGNQRVEPLEEFNTHQVNATSFRLFLWSDGVYRSLYDIGHHNSCRDIS